MKTQGNFEFSYKFRSGQRRISLTVGHFRICMNFVGNLKFKICPEPNTCVSLKISIEKTGHLFFEIEDRLEKTQAPESMIVAHPKPSISRTYRRMCTRRCQSFNEHNVENRKIKRRHFGNAGRKSRADCRSELAV
jgi:hypothetical protein